MYYPPINAGSLAGLPERVDRHLPISIAGVQLLMVTGCLDRN